MSEIDRFLGKSTMSGGKKASDYDGHGEDLNILPDAPANAVMTGDIVFDPYTNFSTFTGKWGFTLQEIKDGLCNACVYKGKFREPKDVEGTFTFSTQDGQEKIKDSFVMKMHSTGTRWLHDITAKGKNKFGPFSMKGSVNMEEGQNTGTFELSKWYTVPEPDSSGRRDKKRKR